MSDLELFHYWRSSCSWRVRWALNEKGVAYKSTPINLLKGENRTPEYLARVPTGFVPSLRVGEETFAESTAILEWIEETFPGQRLLPQDGPSRLRVRQLTAVITNGTQPLQNLAAQRYFSNDPKERLAYAQHWIRKGLSAYESLVQETAGTYSFGAEPSFADLALVPQCYNAERFEVDLAEFPTVAGINRRCLARPACEKAAPANQPGAQG